MSEFIKSLKNSFDEKNYIKNIDRLSMTDTNNMGNLCQVKINARPNLEKVFVDEKTKNRRIFIEASSELFKRKFLGFYLPLVICGLNVFEYVSPKSVVVKDLNRYNQTSIVCEDGVVVSRSENDKFYEGFDLSFVDGESKASASFRDQITFYIMDGSDGLKFDLSRDRSDGHIYCSGSESGFYSLASLDSTEKLNEELPEEYKELFDDVVDYLLTDAAIKDGYRESLKKLTDSEKKKIVFEAIEYEKLGKEEVEVYSYHVFRKIVYGVLAIIAASYIFSRYCNNTPSHWDKLIVTEDGLEYDNENDEDTVYNLFYKYKQAFICAEEKRIEKCYEATRYIDNASTLFTKRELEVAKKFVKKL